MKKILIPLTVVSTAIASVAVVSCGNDSVNHKPVDEKLVNRNIKELKPKISNLIKSKEFKSMLKAINVSVTDEELNDQNFSVIKFIDKLAAGTSNMITEKAMPALDELMAKNKFLDKDSEEYKKIKTALQRISKNIVPEVAEALKSILSHDKFAEDVNSFIKIIGEIVSKFSGGDSESKSTLFTELFGGIKTMISSDLFKNVVDEALQVVRKVLKNIQQENLIDLVIDNLVIPTETLTKIKLLKPVIKLVVEELSDSLTSENFSKVDSWGLDKAKTYVITMLNAREKLEAARKAAKEYSDNNYGNTNPELEKKSTDALAEYEKVKKIEDIVFPVIDKVIDVFLPKFKANKDYSSWIDVGKSQLLNILNKDISN